MINPETPSEEASLEEEPAVDRSVLVEKLFRRTEGGAPADIVCLDVDGTVYLPVRNLDGNWEKVGDNRELSNKLKEDKIPLILISARPDWETQDDHEMAGFALDQADAVIVGTGSIIYWRQKDGSLAIDREFEKLMLRQSLRFRNGEETTYNPETIVQALEDKLMSEFKDKGLIQIKVDSNSSIGFATCDIENMSYSDLMKLSRAIRYEVSGVTITFSEDIKKDQRDKFSGWMQILPMKANKNYALRYALEKISRVTNPYDIEAKKPVAHTFGDSSVDICMLGLCTGEKHPYESRGYLLGNTTPHARDRILSIVGAFDVSENEIREIQHLIEEEQLAQEVNRLRREAAEMREQGNTARIEEIKKRRRSIAAIQRPENPRANVTIIPSQGPEGVISVVEKLASLSQSA